MARKFVSHTSASQTVDGPKGRNNRLDRGGSVALNRVTETGSQKATVRTVDPKSASQTGDRGQVSVRVTPENQHGTTGTVQPASKQPR